MNHHQAIQDFKAICIEEAVNFCVPPALTEIILIRLLFKRKEKYLIPTLLESGPLFRMLTNLNGKFRVLLSKDQPTIIFSDGKIIGSDFQKFNPAYFRWEALVHYTYMDIRPVEREQITRSINQRMDEVLILSYV